MKIKNEQFKATVTNNGELVSFDAVECLINYLKAVNNETLSDLKVADYKTGKLIDAKTAYYLKSKAIPSPMGANLSAYETKESAEKMSNKKGGDVYSWEALKEKFKNSSFGYIEHNHFRPDAHAPIGVMGDHLHEKGGFMFSLRYMTMFMEDNKVGTESISNDAIYNSFMVAPQDMTMDMYMLGIMYAPSNKLTLMYMQNFTKKNMDLTARMMMPNGMIMLRDFTTNSTGIGDIKLNALFSIFNNHSNSLHLNGGVSIPVGPITNRDDTPMIQDVKLPYAMQIGSGTFDAQLGATYKESYTNTSWGIQFLSTLRVGENSENYRFGNIYQLNAWGAYAITNTVSLSVRALSFSEDKIKGMDSELNPMMVTTANTENYGKHFIKAFGGVNLAFPENSALKNFRVGIEAGAPIYEYYKGIQMDENLSAQLGLKYSI
jgi:hypothetical protein